MTRDRTAATVAVTEAAADALRDWLQTQPKAQGASETTETLSPAVEAAPIASAEPAVAPDAPDAAPGSGGPAPTPDPDPAAVPGVPPASPAVAPDAPALRIAPVAPVAPDAPAGPADAPVEPGANTDWLHHRLSVTGPTEVVAAFRQKAAGAGTIPWQLDFDRLQEDWFHRLVSPPAPLRRSLSVAGARVLAEQLRDAVERRQARAVARVGISTACRFDLHALLPVPATVLALGPDHPGALAWLWQHWGTTQALRHVTEDPAKIPATDPTWRLQFWSADWTPWRAILALQTIWPALRFSVRPSYGAT